MNTRPSILRLLLASARLPSGHALALLGALSPFAAGAQTAIEEITVTATKRGAESVQSIPISITAISGEALADAGATQFAQDPYLRDKLRLRSWDEAAKDPQWQGPGIETYREMLLRHLSREG